MGLFRPYQPNKPSNPAVTQPAATPAAAPGRPAGKGVPTPSRREAELARRQRLSPTLTKKELRLKNRESNAAIRARSTSAVEGRPERALLRDHVDARWNVGEFALPIMLVLLAASLLNGYLPGIVVYASAATWFVLASIIIDAYMMWRGFKKVLAERMPDATSKGLFMYGLNRQIQLRRFRQPPARIKRGDTY